MSPMSARPKQIGELFLRELRFSKENPDTYHAWPCTVVATRYAGAYEHGDYAAFPVDAWMLSQEDWAAGDIECDGWWIDARARELPIGLGATPGEAFDDMQKKLKGPGTVTP